MKRLLLFILIGIYLPSTIGVYASAHFCGNERASFQLFSSDHESCGCNPSAQMSCCKDVSALIKIEQAHQVTKTKFPRLFKSAIIKPWFAIKATQTHHETELELSSFHLPLASVPIRIRFCIFRN